MHYKAELSRIRNQDVDITNFKEGFAKKYELFKTAIKEIDKTIDHINKTKEALLS